jgi:Ni/Fe-hydrogenase subunit HybB-like protein
MSDSIPDSLNEQLSHQLSQVVGFIYPNEVETQWAILIVVYPYLTGIVAGAFILASLVKVFNVVEVQPIYRLALLTALSFMLVAGMPLQLHLGHPERAYEIFFTPQTTSVGAHGAAVPRLAEGNLRRPVAVFERRERRGA